MSFLDKAMQQRAAVIPPKPKREILQQTFQDCAMQERSYLGLDSATVDTGASEKKINRHREQMLKKFIDAQSYYETQVGDTIALLTITKAVCKIADQKKIEEYLAIAKKNFIWPSNAHEDFFEVLYIPEESYKWRAEEVGEQVWCAESKKLFENAGARDVFPK